MAGRIEHGGTRNAAAFDSYLRATKAYSTAHNPADLEAAVDAYSEGIRLDPHFALAFAGRAEALYRDADEWLSGAAARGWSRDLPALTAFGKLYPNPHADRPRR